jgi:hypothetical protein
MSRSRQACFEVKQYKVTSHPLSGCRICFGMGFYADPLHYILNRSESSSTSVVSVFNSLQGLYNFFVYMFPKVRNSKKGRNSHDITWCQAFTKAWTSRGDLQKNDNTILKVQSVDPNLDPNLTNPYFIPRQVRRYMNGHIQETNGLFTAPFTYSRARIYSIAYLQPRAAPIFTALPFIRCGYLQLATNNYLQSQTRQSHTD